MANQFMIFFFGFSVLASTIHGTTLVSQVLYWNTKLPDNAMPSSIWEQLKRPAGNNVEGCLTKDPPPNFFAYPSDYRKSEPVDVIHQLKENNIFFQEKDLHAGKKMNLSLHKPRPECVFHPSHLSDSLPFSSARLPAILSHFSITPGSPSATIINQALQECESPAMGGEEKTCTGSVKGMVDWATAILGKNVKVRATEVEAGVEPRTYTVRSSGVTKLKGSSITCHRVPYAYAVHYCHRLRDTDVYEVKMAREDDGAEMVAAAVCHKETSAWNPQFIGLKVLNVEPGTVPVCHFVPHGHLLWVASDAPSLLPVAF